MPPGGRIEKDIYTQRSLTFDSNCSESCSFLIWAAHFCSFSCLTSHVASHVFWPVIIICHFIMWYLWEALNEVYQNYFTARSMAILPSVDMHQGFGTCSPLILDKRPWLTVLWSLLRKKHMWYLVFHMWAETFHMWCCDFICELKIHIWKSHVYLTFTC